MKRLIAMLLALALTVSVIPVSAMPAAAEELQLTENPTVVEEPAEEVAEPTEEVEEPTEEVAEPTEEVEEPTEEVAEPTEEVVEPTEEAVEPTEEDSSRPDVPTRASVYKSGTWGTNLTWTIYSDGVMVISGIGEMAAIGYYGDDAPWYRYSYDITSVVVEEGVTTVDDYAFYRYYKLTSVTLPKSMRYVGEYAFAESSALVTADLGGTTEIGMRAFDECKKLQTVTMPNIVDIGYSAFYSCNALKSATIPEGLTTIGESAFSGTALTGELVLPDSVTSIGLGAFSGNDSLTAVVFGNGVTQTGSKAFYGCDNLTKITFGNNLETISSECFRNCVSLTEVYIPDSVTLIGDSAFYGCEAITDVYIGSGVTDFRNTAFKYCSAIENVWYRGTQEMWTALKIYTNDYDGTSYITKANRYYMMGGCGEQVWWDVAFDGTMTIAGEGPMFDYGGEMGWPDWNDNVYTKVKKIVVEPGVTKIGNESFGWMDNLTEVVLPEGLEEIGAYAFPNSNALKTVKLPKSLTGYWTGAFYGCASLDGIWAHEDSEHYYNDSYGVLFNKDGVLIQAPGSLSGTYTIPEGVTTIAPYAFAQCEKLELVNYPASVTTIGDYAFYRCFGLTKLNIPETVKEIGSGAFVMCTGLTTLDIPKGITRIEEAVFDECFGLTEIVIPDNITYIGNSAFFDCFNVTSVTIPDSVTYIDDYAFSWLWALESVTIPDSVTYLGMGAFDECTALKSVNLGTGLTTLEESTFSGCVALEEVYIPKNVNTIIAGAFNACESLHTVWYNGTEADWNIMEITNQGNEYLQGVRIQFIKDRGNCGTGVSWRMMQDGSLVITGNGAMDDYTETPAPWASYQKEIEYLQVADGVTSIGANAFAGLTKLVYAEIRDDVATIGEGAFSGCAALPAIGFPETVTAIPANAFSGCTSLEEVYLPEQLTVIGENAFAGCAKLPAIDLPATLTEIGAGAFSGCKALAAIAIPAAVTTIGDGAFGGTALANIVVHENNTAYYTDEAGVLYNKEQTKLLLTPNTLAGHYVIPMSVTEIAADAFNTKELTGVTIPAGVASIGQNAFKACYKLRSVRYYGSSADWDVIEIASGNDWLKKAGFVYTEAAGTCGENLTWEMETGGQLIISGSGAMNDYLLESAPWAEVAESVREVRIGQQVTTIGAGAFAGFTGLTELQIPDSITAIGTEAFIGCTELTSLTIGNGVTQVGEDAFLGCKSLKTVSVGTGLKVDRLTFASCIALEAINVDATNPYCKSVDGLVYSADGTVLVAVPLGCSGSITLPAGVEVIDANVFENAGVTSLILPEGLTTISDGAFMNAFIKEVKFPNTLKQIGAYAFAGTKLQSLMLPNGLVSIADSAFISCDELTTVVLPVGLTTVNASTFEGCTALKTVTLPITVETIETNAFAGCSGLTTVFWQGNAEEFGQLIIREGNEAFTGAQIVADQTVLVMAAPTTTGKPQIQWESLEGVTKYEVHRATSLDGKYKKLKTVSATTYTDTSASAGTEYYYKIKALYGKTAVEIGVAAARCVCAQAKVKVSVSTSTGLPSLSWSKVSGVYRYVILRAESATATDEEYTELAVQKGTSFTDKTAQNDTVYYYKVLVTSSKENADCISPAPVRVITGIAKPSMKVAANENGKPQITCAPLAGAVKYELYRATSSKGTYTKIQTGYEPLFVDETAEIGKTYYYKLGAVGKNSQSSLSSYDDVRCVAIRPEIVVVRNDATGKASITWEAVEGANKYEIYRATKENGSYKKVATTSELTYEDTKASVGYTYYYKVYTVPSNSKAKSVASNIGSVYAICAQPVLKVSYNSVGQHTISWSKVSGAKTYQIWRADSADGEFVLLANQKGTSYVDKNTQPDTAYYYYVNVIASKVENNSLTMEPVKIARAIASPKITAGNDAEGKPYITWDAVEGAVRFKIYRATSSKGTYTLVGNVTGNSFTDRRMSLGSRYYYKVVALGNNSESAMSSYDDAYGTLPVPYFTGSEQDLATGKPVIFWDPVEGAVKYDVYRASSADGTYKKIASGVKTVSYYDVNNNLYYMTYTDADANNNTTYYYKVVAVASDSKANSVKSDWISVTSGNISASDAKVRAILIKMERWPAYLRLEYGILLLRIERYLKYDGSAATYADVLDGISDVYEHIMKIYSLCGSNRSLKLLKDMCRDADHPKFNGSFENYASQGRALARDAKKIVIMYNIICKSYGLPGVGDVVEPDI